MHFCIPPSSLFVVQSSRFHFLLPTGVYHSFPWFIKASKDADNTTLVPFDQCLSWSLNPYTQLSVDHRHSYVHWALLKSRGTKIYCIVSAHGVYLVCQTVGKYTSVCFNCWNLGSLSYFSFDLVSRHSTYFDRFFTCLFALMFLFVNFCVVSYSLETTNSLYLNWLW